MKFNFDDLRSIENFSKNFLLTWEHSIEELKATIHVAELFRKLHKEGKSFRQFDTGLAVSIFRDNSTRTRYSFQSAANALGLAVMDLDEKKSQIAHGETVRETANMLSFMTQIVGIRDDMFLGQGNSYMREVGEALDMGFDEGTLHQRPGLVNLQCDIDHPTQSMSDLAMLKQYFGSLDALKGKKVAMTWAYSPSYGKPLSVPQGIIGLLPRFGIDVTLAFPEGYDLIPDVINTARANANIAGSEFTITNSMTDAFTNADVVYPKSWAPFHVMEKRTELLMTGNDESLKDLEQECLLNNSSFTDWECTEDKMKLTKNGSALYMHCLPADITGVSCKQGEVSASVFERYRKETYLEASYKPFIIAAMMFLLTTDNPIEKISKLLKN
ncbi:MAG: knotted carbamoyltransferase YgeW [Candidatus Marinimicrobia bacterium]|jgi:knotted carbamoyltransferase YgeW|nr:knotted carbamoyltransferase YgeW [Candidatus Neomarinimicrobiota bacterium]MBT3633750.1 knotted carbamoyltransferase YgeW [Candidatus Neomarinimicrobiota bacterium]MBT3682542.1 knotted carbamoyltransferase YgeW [Candidatus Neomarinimicrobiota bacterium]MBT3759306.1 knotted carbamoyltransferase YgeW [Candidatus Neomarinimicrobiota bacterium]MBT3894686.1 knotted carbamoyltransferase YgeW [Candidatus Neomarinimicrobiota bacterium]